jgi:hypothetical protein
VRQLASQQVRRSPDDTRFEDLQSLSILKLFVRFSSGLSSVCHFGHDGEIMGVIRDRGHAVVPAGRTGGGTASYFDLKKSLRVEAPGRH